jgi:hypothetical protein
MVLTIISQFYDSIRPLLERKQEQLWRAVEETKRQVEEAETAKRQKREAERHRHVQGVEELLAKAVRERDAARVRAREEARRNALPAICKTVLKAAGLDDNAAMTAGGYRTSSVVKRLMHFAVDGLSIPPKSGLVDEPPQAAEVKNEDEPSEQEQAFFGSLGKGDDEKDWKPQRQGFVPLMDEYDLVLYVLSVPATVEIADSLVVCG